MNLNDLKILFKVTTRERPYRFMQAINSIERNCMSENYQILVSIDEDDVSMNYTIRQECAARNIILKTGTSLNKVDAINRDMDAASAMPWDIVVNVSDDMQFTTAAFDYHIRNEFSAGLDAFVHFPDNNRCDISTLSIMGRPYYDRLNYIYYPQYISVCCDEDATLQAKFLGKYRFNPMVIVQHNHPGYKTAEWDQLYERNESPEIYIKDWQTLRLRRDNNFQDIQHLIT